MGLTTQHKQIIAKWKISAQKGNSEAQYKIAEFHWFGNAEEYNIKQDKKRAINIWQTLVKKNNPDAQCMLACFKWCGNEINGKRQAIKVWKNLAKERHVESQYRIAERQWVGDAVNYGVAPNKQQAIKSWFLLAQKGHLNAQYRIAELLWQYNLFAINVLRTLSFGIAKKLSNMQSIKKHAADIFDWLTKNGHPLCGTWLINPSE